MVSANADKRGSRTFFTERGSGVYIVCRGAEVGSEVRVLFSIFREFIRHEFSVPVPLPSAAHEM